VSYRFCAFGVPQHLTELWQKRAYVPDPKPALRLAPKRTESVLPADQDRGEVGNAGVVSEASQDTTTF
jgi:hypothetical protein